jgi:hypothetical protein
LLESGEPFPARDVVLERSDGTERHIELGPAQVVHYLDQNAVLLFARDVTPVNELDRKLALSALADDVVRSMNQSLGLVMVNLCLIENQIDDIIDQDDIEPGPALRKVKHMVDQTRRQAELSVEDTITSWAATAIA